MPYLTPSEFAEFERLKVAAAREEECRKVLANLASASVLIRVLLVKLGVGKCHKLDTFIRALEAALAFLRTPH